MATSQGTRTKDTNWKREVEVLLPGYDLGSIGGKGTFERKHSVEDIMRVLEANRIQRPAIQAMRRKKEGPATKTIEQRLKGLFGGGEKT